MRVHVATFLSNSLALLIHTLPQAMQGTPHAEARAGLTGLAGVAIEHKDFFDSEFCLLACAIYFPCQPFS